MVSLLLYITKGGGGVPVVILIAEMDTHVCSSMINFTPFQEIFWEKVPLFATKSRKCQLIKRTLFSKSRTKIKRHKLLLQAF